MQLWLGLERLASFRRTFGVLLLVACIALPLLAREATQWRAQRDVARQRLASLENARRIEQSAAAQLARWRQAHQRWGGLSDQARSLGWAIDLWEKHSVLVDSKRFSRHETDVLLASLTPGRDAFLMPESFSVKLVGGKDSLLVPYRDADRDASVVVTLRGTYYSRRTP